MQSVRQEIQIIRDLFLFRQINEMMIRCEKFCSYSLIFSYICRSYAAISYDHNIPQNLIQTPHMRLNLFLLNFWNMIIIWEITIIWDGQNALATKEQMIVIWEILIIWDSTNAFKIFLAIFRRCILIVLLNPNIIKNKVE